MTIVNIGHRLDKNSMQNHKTQKATGFGGNIIVGLLFVGSIFLLVLFSLLLNFCPFVLLLVVFREKLCASSLGVNVHGRRSVFPSNSVAPFIVPVNVSCVRVKLQTHKQNKSDLPFSCQDLSCFIIIVRLGLSRHRIRLM